MKKLPKKLQDDCLAMSLDIIERLTTFKCNDEQKELALKFVHDLRKMMEK